MSSESSAQKQGCPLPRIRADWAEDAILKKLDEVLVKAGHLKSGYQRVVEKARSDIESHRFMKRHFIKCLKEINMGTSNALNLGKHIKEGDAAKLVEERLNKLAEDKAQMLKNLDEVNVKIETCKEVAKNAAINVDDNELLKAFWRGWKKATSAQKKHLLRRVFDVIVVTRDGMDAHYWVYPD